MEAVLDLLVDGRVAELERDPVEEIRLGDRAVEVEDDGPALRAVAFQIRVRHVIMFPEINSSEVSRWLPRKPLRQLRDEDRLRRRRTCRPVPGDPDEGPRPGTRRHGLRAEPSRGDARVGRGVLERPRGAARGERPGQRERDSRELVQVERPATGRRRRRAGARGRARLRHRPPAVARHPGRARTGTRRAGRVRERDREHGRAARRPDRGV